MIPTRQSDATQENEKVREVKRRRGENNSEWLARNLGRTNWTNSILLLGGTDLTAFRLRVAQSHARRDMLPSFWSHVALLRSRLVDGKAVLARSELYEVSLCPSSGFGPVPKKNGLQKGTFAAYNDAAAYPNVACIRFPTSGANIAAAIKRFQGERTAVDVGNLIVQWLAFVWGVGEQGNPLIQGTGVPSAALVEGVFALAGLELTPGLSTRSSCPEAIWQSARWWYRFFESEAVEEQVAPQGFYVVGQRAAAVIDDED